MIGSGFLCSQQCLASFQGNINVIALHLQKLQAQGHWEQAQPAPLILLSATVNAFASQLSQQFAVSAAEMLRISDFRGHSLGMMEMCRKKRILEILSALHVV